MKTSELTGAALNWAVACARWGGGNFGIDGFSPSTNWAQGGPIIEREMIELVPQSDSLWDAMYRGQHIPNDGPTPLIAAMRCYVASKLGDEIEIPTEITA
jgi:hypothetical protein